MCEERKGEDTDFSSGGVWMMYGTGRDQTWSFTLSSNIL